MAAPIEASLKDMTGQWVVNHHLSDKFDALLALQGLAWWKRQARSLAVSFVTLTEHTKQYNDDQKVTHIDIEQRISGGFKGGIENRILDWKEREFPNETWGTMKERARWIHLSVLDDEYLKEGWLDSDDEKGGPDGEKHILVVTVSEQGEWTVTAVWGFVDINGQRYHARKVACRKGEEVVRSRGIYSWKANKGAHGTKAG